MQQAYQTGKKFLAIRMNEKECKLEVNVYDNQNVPGLLIGLILEDSASKDKKTNLRRLLQRRLDIWCEIGGFSTRVPISATQVLFYPLSADVADATLDLIVTKLATRFEIPEVELQPKTKKLKIPVQVRESDGY
jgi:predicted transport protein